MATPSDKAARDLAIQEDALSLLLDTRKTYHRAKKKLDAALEQRDEAIVLASKAGLSRRVVARAAGVTVGRVQQIIDAAHGGAPLSKSKILRHPTTGRRVVRAK